MPQNLVSLAIGTDDYAAIDNALNTLEQRFTGLISLLPAERRSLTRMGDKSEAFCRQVITVLAQNPAVVPPAYDLPEAQRDLAALDTLRGRLARMRQLLERATDTEDALSSDVMSAALEGYALLKISGKAQGLDGLRQSLSARFARRSPGSATAPATSAGSAASPVV